MLGDWSVLAGGSGSGTSSGKMAANYSGQTVYKIILRTEPTTRAVTTDLEDPYIIANARAGWYRVFAVYGPEATVALGLGPKP